MSFLDRDRILGLADARVERVEVPEWGGHVFVRSLSVAELDRFRADGERQKASGGLHDATVRLVVLAACDERGAPLFRPEDAQALRDKSVAAVERVGAAALRLNTVTEAAADAAEKNSDATPSPGS